MRRALKVVGVGLAAVLVAAAVAVSAYVGLASMMDDSRALPRVSAAQFEAVELGLTSDQLLERLGPSWLIGDAVIGGRPEECRYYAVAGDSGGVADDAYRFCFFGDRLAHKQHRAFPE